MAAPSFYVLPFLNAVEQNIIEEGRKSVHRTGRILRRFFRLFCCSWKLMKFSLRSTFSTYWKKNLSTADQIHKVFSSSDISLILNLRVTDSLCPDNEVFVDCVITCNDCITRGNCEQFVCNPGCDCVDGFFRDRYGNCIPSDRCQQSLCPPNEEYTDCVNPCNDCTIRGRCRFFACNPGCNCVQDHYRNEYGVCIPQELCPGPKTCKPDEQFYQCVPTCKNTCENFNQNTPCLLYCKQGCFCKEGQVKNNRGKCVRPSECEQMHCGQNEVYSTCVSPCNTCSRRGRCDFSECSPGCECRSGYFRNDAGYCVLEEQCPQYICGINEEHSDCVNPCNTCISRGSCPFAICNPGCDCRVGFYRNSSGICIPEANCPTSIPRNCPVDEQYYDCMPDCKNTCKNIFNPETVCAAVCRPGCFCEEGLVRNQIGDCVFPDECEDVTCRTNEQFYPCMPLCAHTCETRNMTSYTCSEICKPGCFCKEGFVKKRDGTCVRPENCYRERCKLGERYYDCVPDCRNTCENFFNPNLVCTAQCRPGCFCQEGLLKRKDGKCVLPSACKKACKPDEQFYQCKPDCKNTCENINNPSAYCLQVCISGCFCREGLVKRSDGRCCPASECGLVIPILARRRGNDNSDNTTVLPISTSGIFSNTTATGTPAMPAGTETTGTAAETTRTERTVTQSTGTPSTNVPITTDVPRTDVPPNEAVTTTKKPKNRRRPKPHAKGKKTKTTVPVLTTEMPSTFSPQIVPRGGHSNNVVARKRHQNETDDRNLSTPALFDEGDVSTTAPDVMTRKPQAKIGRGKKPHKNFGVTVNPDLVKTAIRKHKRKNIEEFTTLRIPIKRDINILPKDINAATTSSTDESISDQETASTETLSITTQRSSRLRTTVEKEVEKTIITIRSRNFDERNFETTSTLEPDGSISRSNPQLDVTTTKPTKSDTSAEKISTETDRIATSTSAFNALPKRGKNRSKFKLTTSNPQFVPRRGHSNILARKQHPKGDDDNNLGTVSNKSTTTQLVEKTDATTESLTTIPSDAVRTTVTIFDVPAKKPHKPQKQRPNPRLKSKGKQKTDSTTIATTELPTITFPQESKSTENEMFVTSTVKQVEDMFPRKKHWNELPGWNKSAITSTERTLVTIASFDTSFVGKRQQIPRTNPRFKSNRNQDVTRTVLVTRSPVNASESFIKTTDGTKVTPSVFETDSTVGHSTQLDISNIRRLNIKSSQVKKAQNSKTNTSTQRSQELSTSVLTTNKSLDESLFLRNREGSGLTTVTTTNITKENDPIISATTQEPADEKEIAWNMETKTFPDFTPFNSEFTESDETNTDSSVVGQSMKDDIGTTSDEELTLSTVTESTAEKLTTKQNKDTTQPTTNGTTRRESPSTKRIRIRPLKITTTDPTD